MNEHDVIKTILVFAIPLFWFGLFLLLFRLVCKFKWVAAVCLAVMTTTVSSLLSLWLFTGLTASAGLVVLLPSAVCGVILIIQLLWWAAGGEGEAVNAAERAKILRMVEDGKISADEGSDLLDAMGRSTALRGQEKFSRADIVMLVGAALVILGFFLPWVYFRMPPVPTMDKSLGPEMTKPFSIWPFNNVWAFKAGRHTGALGWTIFIIGILSAVPVFVTPKDFLYKISMLQIFLILIGLVLVILILVDVNKNLGAGLIICLVGFIVELVASAAKFKKLAA